MLEIAPSREVLHPSWTMRVKSTFPTGQRQYEDVQRFGNLGDVSDQLTLAAFVEARAKNHGDYPYLTWASDQCSSSPDNRRFGIVDPEREHSADYHTGLVAYRVVRVYHACWRHDFNWRNLPRIQYQVDPAIQSWNDDTKSEADMQFGTDIRAMCDATLTGAAWAAVRETCYRRAAIYEFVVSSIPIGTLNTTSPTGPPERTE